MVRGAYIKTKPNLLRMAVRVVWYSLMQRRKAQ